MMPTVTLVTNRATTSPLIARNPALGLSASRRAAISGAGRWARRAISRAPAMVSHGPATISPASRSRNPGRKARIWPPVVGGRPTPTITASSARPASSGISRQIRGGLGVARRVTPSGDTWTRRSAISAATAAATGTPTATARTSARFSDRSLVKNGAPVNEMAAMAGRSA